MLPESITALIAALSKLPGIGPRSAERIALAPRASRSGAVKQLAETMLQRPREDPVLRRPAAR